MSVNKFGLYIILLHSLAHKVLLGARATKIEGAARTLRRGRIASTPWNFSSAQNLPHSGSRMELDKVVHTVDRGLQVAQLVSLKNFWTTSPRVILIAGFGTSHPRTCSSRRCWNLPPVWINSRLALAWADDHGGLGENPQNIFASPKTRW